MMPRYGATAEARIVVVGRPCLSVCVCMVRRSVSYVDMLRRRCGAGQWSVAKSQFLVVERGERALTAFFNPDY
jgi:hypothetical protein